MKALITVYDEAYSLFELQLNVDIQAFILVFELIKLSVVVNSEMEILIVGHLENLEEARQKFGRSHTYALEEGKLGQEITFTKYDVVFDFTIGHDSSAIKRYQGPSAPIVFLDVSTISLKQLSDASTQILFFGFCGMPGFLNGEIMEVCVRHERDLNKLKEVCHELKTDYRVVADRVGLVTPRVVCMIINEAYCTVEEGTATRDDVDLAMKLGTNYPFGPFEWGLRIGLSHVCALLDAVHRDTADERYKICPLLRSEMRLASGSV